MIRAPNFIVIGAQKSGTTSLFHQLRREKNVFMPKEKELHYFTTNYNKGDLWYEQHFDGKASGQIGGEITPFYLYYRKAAERIHRYSKKMKLIVLLRNPIDRAISHYFHARQRNFEDLNMLEAFMQEEKRIRKNGIYSIQKHSYISRSKYIEQIDRYYQHFPKEQLLILKSEDMFSNMKLTKNKIGEFLEMELINDSSEKTIQNKGKHEKTKLSKEVVKYLEENLQETIKSAREQYGIIW